MNDRHLTSEQVTAAAYGILDGEEAESLRCHLDDCPDCSGRVESVADGRERLLESLEEPAEIVSAPRVSRLRIFEFMAAAIPLAVVAYALFSDGNEGSRTPAGRQDSPSEVARLWLEDLRSDDPEVRERATRNMENLGPEVEEQLRNRLAQEQDPDVRVRLEKILKRLLRPTGGELAQVTPQGWIRFRSADGDRSREYVVPGRGEDIHTLTWSADGRWLAFGVGNPLSMSELFVLDAVSGESRSVTKTFHHLPIWSHDSRYLYFLDEARGLHRVEVRQWGIEAVPLPHTQMPNRVPLFWSRDGRFLVLQELDAGGKGGDAVRFDTFGNEAKPWIDRILMPVASAGESLLFCFSSDPDGRVTNTTATYPLLLHDLKTGDVRKLAEGVAISETDIACMRGGRLIPAPDGRSVAFLRGGEAWMSGVLCLIDVEKGVEVRIGRAKRAGWSPDSRVLAYEREEGGIALRNRDSGAETIVEGSVPAWSPVPERR